MVVFEPVVVPLGEPTTTFSTSWEVFDTLFRFTQLSKRNLLGNGRHEQEKVLSRKVFTPRAEPRCLAHPQLGLLYAVATLAKG
jgi:hypothetical protein